MNLSHPKVGGTRARTQPEPLTAFGPPELQDCKNQEMFLRSCEPDSGRKKTDFSYIDISQALSSPVLFCAEERAKGVGPAVLYPAVLSLFLKSVFYAITFNRHRCDSETLRGAGA